jgi:hypothetical protein
MHAVIVVPGIMGTELFLPVLLALPMKDLAADCA